MRYIPNDGKRHAQRHAFVLANNLIPKLKQQGITEQELWEAVKSECTRLKSTQRANVTRSRVPRNRKPYFEYEGLLTHYPYDK